MGIARNGVVPESTLLKKRRAVQDGPTAGVCDVADAQGGGAGGRRKVLIADDNADAAESLAMLLELMGNEVCTAADGVAAVEAAEAFRPDVAVLDIGMPRLDGNGAARRIRAAEWGRRTVLIALTGWGQPDDRRKTAEAGFDVHLTKPVDPSTLDALLAELCRKK
jgi:CheY-like chemotaxis protein